MTWLPRCTDCSSCCFGTCKWMVNENWPTNDIPMISWFWVLSFLLKQMDCRERTEQNNISGEMHSGHPMMGFTSAVPALINATSLRHLGTWGLIHEIGHNHQWDSWTVPATTETGCNFFSLYVNQNVRQTNWMIFFIL